MSEQLVIGVDIGATKIAFVMISGMGEILAESYEPTPVTEGVTSVLDRVADGIHRLCSQTRTEVSGIGIGCTGTVNPYNGVVLSAANLAWNDVPIRREIGQRLAPCSIPIWVQNDVNAAALGEMFFGAARSHKDFVYIGIGTGLGAGAIAGGILIEGANFQALEVGHLSMGLAGRRCGCGQHGCPEMYVSGIGLKAGFLEHRTEWARSALAQQDRPSTEEILHAARSNDPLALYLLEDASDHLSSVAIACIKVLDPELFVIGGGVGLAAYDMLCSGVMRKVETRIPNAQGPMPSFIRSEISNSAVGAACLPRYYTERSQCRHNRTDCSASSS